VEGDALPLSFTVVGLGILGSFVPPRCRSLIGSARRVRGYGFAIRSVTSRSASYSCSRHQ